MKPRKVRDGSTNSERRAVLHQAADESFVRGQELSCAKEGFYTTEDAQLANGFGSQLGNVAFPGNTVRPRKDRKDSSGSPGFPRKFMADSETQKLE